MKAKDAERAAILVEALGELEGLDKALQRKKPTQGYYRRGLEFSVIDENPGSGSSGDWCIFLDTHTGRLLVPQIRETIEKELRALGVTL